MARRNTPLSGIPLTGPALRDALWMAGLAPTGTEEKVSPLGAILMWRGREWEPWLEIGEIWHLVLRYRLHLVLWPQHPRVVCGLAKSALCGMSEEATSDEDLVAAVGRLALRLRTAELAQEAQL